MNQPQLRQPAGTPTGGQFATSARPEATTSLSQRTVEDDLVDTVMNAFPWAADAGKAFVIDRVDAQRHARSVLCHLSDAEFYDRHWFAVESAGMLWQKFGSDEDGEEVDGASPDELLDLDLEDFMRVNPPDRAGEAGYVGYDFPAAAEELASKWEAELRSRVALAVQADRAAASPAAA